ARSGNQGRYVHLGHTDARSQPYLRPFVEDHREVRRIGADNQRAVVRTSCHNTAKMLFGERRGCDREKTDQDRRQNRDLLRGSTVHTSSSILFSVAANHVNGSRSTAREGARTTP